jgi:hypothetical protein
MLETIALLALKSDAYDLQRQNQMATGVSAQSLSGTSEQYGKRKLHGTHLYSGDAYNELRPLLRLVWRGRP